MFSFLKPFKASLERIWLNVLVKNKNHPILMKFDLGDGTITHFLIVGILGNS